ncbi:nuclear transport factor 2 family protein [Massilia sp. TSP1-1-2]|uniref:nuclear transport factor 2 family protein n=1 Tax=unclassified Massilia TaxID=2609279 RepID=UPI003CF265EA
MNREPELERLVRFFETISGDDLHERLAQVYAVDARFKDPFNEVCGLGEIARIFEHMFEQVKAPRFVVTTKVLQGPQAFLTWEFLFEMKRFSKETQTIVGATQIIFDADGKVAVHRDYWDAAEELYEKLPLIGSLMRWLKRAANK